MKTNKNKPTVLLNATIIYCTKKTIRFFAFNTFLKNNKALLTLALLICFQSIFSQDQKVDSLSNLLQKETDINVKLALINDIANIEFQSDFKKALVYSRQGVLLSEKTKHLEWQPKFYEMTGRIHANLLELDSASFYFNKALTGYKTVKNKKGQATTYFKIGWVHKRKGEIEDALKVDLEALKLMESINDKAGIAGAYGRISEDLNKQGRYNEALEYALKTIEICQKNQFNTELVYAYTSAGDTYIYLGDFLESYNYYD